MTDTTLTPSAAGSGSVTVTASAALFSTTDDVGRLLSLKMAAPKRAAATAYAVGVIFWSDDRGVVRLYRVIKAGTSAAADMAGTTPDYDQAVPVLQTTDVVDGTCLLTYLGRGKSAWSWGKITAVASTTVATVDISTVAPLAGTDATYNWALGEWGGSRGWPGTCAIYSSRLIWAGSIANPQTIWTSETGDFETMTPREPDGQVFDTNGLTYTLDDDQLQQILWLLTIPRGLAIGALSGEFLFGPAVQQQALGPSNAKASRQGVRGSSIDVPGLLADKIAVFTQRNGQKHRQLNYDFYSDSYSTSDLSILSDHILEPGIVDIARASDPHGVLWSVRSDGLLVTLTLDTDQKVRAYARHQLGGNASVESICAVPAPDGLSDDIYVSVLRGSGETATRWIEVIRAPYQADLDGSTGGFFADAGLSYSGTPATTISGLTHLEGQSVAVCADGVDVGPLTVASGAITLATAASTVHVGLGFTSRLTTMPLEAGAAPGGTAQGRAKRINEVTLRLLETTGGRFGRDGVLEDIPYPAAVDAPASFSGALYTGDVRATFPAGWDRLGQLTVEQAAPLPMTVLAIIQDVQTNG